MDQSLRTRTEVDFAATVFTNPPFQEDTQEGSKGTPGDEYYFQIHHDLTKKLTDSMPYSHRLVKWLRMSNSKGFIQPYYSAQVKMQQFNSRYTSLLITGGVTYDGRVNVPLPNIRAVRRS